MLALLLILTLFNTIGLAVILTVKFNETFKIVHLDLYNTLLEYWSEYHDDDGNELSRELAGGTGVAVGFGADYLEDDEEEPEEEE